jgi:hypothetical protein
LGWLQFIERSRLINSPEPARLLIEAGEMLHIFAASAGTARHRQRTAFR